MVRDFVQNYFWSALDGRPFLVAWNQPISLATAAANGLGTVLSGHNFKNTSGKTTRCIAAGSQACSNVDLNAWSVYADLKHHNKGKIKMHDQKKREKKKTQRSGASWTSAPSSSKRHDKIVTFSRFRGAVTRLPRRPRHDSDGTR